MEAKNRLNFEVSLLLFCLTSPPSPPRVHTHTCTSLCVCKFVCSKFSKENLYHTKQNTIQYNLIVDTAVFVVWITAVVYFYLFPYQTFDCSSLYTCVDSNLNYSNAVYSKWWASTTILYRLSRILYIVHIILVCHPILCCYQSILET